MSRNVPFESGLLKKPPLLPKVDFSLTLTDFWLAIKCKPKIAI